MSPFSSLMTQIPRFHHPPSQRPTTIGGVTIHDTSLTSTSGSLEDRSGGSARRRRAARMRTIQSIDQNLAMPTDQKAELIERLYFTMIEVAKRVTRSSIWHGRSAKTRRVRMQRRHTPN